MGGSGSPGRQGRAPGKRLRETKRLAAAVVGSPSEALRAEHERALRFLDIAGVILVALDRRGNITLINRKGCRLLGYRRSELLGVSWFDTCLPAGARKPTRIAFRKLMAGEIQAVEFFENPVVTRSGEERIIAWHNAVVHEPGGAVSGTLSSGEDITERRRVERALSHERDLLSRVMDTSPAGIAVLDKEGKFVYVNAQAERILKVKQGGVLDRGINEFPWKVLDGRGKRVSNAIKGLQAFLRTGTPKYGTRYSVEAGDDGPRVLSVNSAPLYNGKEVAGMVAAFFDVTEAARAEGALRESEGLYRTLVETLPDAVAAGRMDGTITFFSRRAMELHGFAGPDDIIGKNVLDLVAPEERGRFLSDFRGLMDTGQVRDKEIPMVRRDGSSFPGELNATVLRDADGRLTGFIGTARDVSERKRVEEDLRASREQLRNLAAYLESVRETERTDVAREIHDELGQALTALKMELAWVHKNLGADQEKLKIKTAAMGQLADGLIQSVKRISSDLRPGLLDDLGLTAALEWQAREFEERTGIRCEMVIESEDVQVASSLTTAVFRIFQEALTNVARHAAATRVTARLGRHGGALELLMKDDGRGISKAETQDPRSYGLIGMRERVRFLGGAIEISGRKREGTTIRVTIPLHGQEGES